MNSNYSIGVDKIDQERFKVINKGRTPEHDSKINNKKQLILATHYILWHGAFGHDLESTKDVLKSEHESGFLENWDLNYLYTLIEKPYEERLVIAGQLIAAEIDRLEFNKQIQNNK